MIIFLSSGIDPKALRPERQMKFQPEWVLEARLTKGSSGGDGRGVLRFCLQCHLGSAAASLGRSGSLAQSLHFFVRSTMHI